ncbi:epiphycan isoform X1 [Melanotaenia boesemani]|uniref:epiphycan isoform X1 n=1 Tax=Melanotaenia boesemani TaxID=1250792 RepID=UPI001C03EE79|nr:epiphycan isoform X1 [Melanotaenia boesemani]
MRMFVQLVFGLFVLKAAVASPRFSRQLDLDTYNSANYDVENEENEYDYDDGLTTDDSQAEIETLAPHYNYPEPGEEELEEEEEQEEGEEEQPLKAQLVPQGSGGSGLLMGPDTQKEEELFPTTPETPQEGAGSQEEIESSGFPEPEQPEKPDEPEVDISGMPTCLLCTCLGGSVYCDDLKLNSVPPLPKDTTHFYARYNKITKINKSDFAFMNKLKRIDLTANEITSIEDRAFIGLPELEELVMRENYISQLPSLPETMTLIDASHNNIGSKGIHKEAFKDMTGLLYLYLTDNNIDYIPVPLPDSLRSLHLQRNNIQMMHEDTFCNLNDFNYIRNALEDIRLDGNPINLSRTPQAYVCLPRIPIGDLI